MIWDEVRSEKGITLLSLALQMVVIGVFLSLALGLYKTYIPYKTSAETSDKLASIQEALEAYYIYNGRYPCPAPLNAGLDSPEFGREASSGACQSDGAPDSGTFRVVGSGGRTVRTGTVPVRTLNLPDKYIYDGYKNRFVYSVTEMYAENDFIPEEDQGGISILDTANLDATSTPGNVVQMVYSTGGDTNGAYSFQGTQVEACDNTGYSGANCDFNNNATFVNTLQKSHNESSNDYFTHMISYGVTKSLYRCEDEASTGPKNTSFLIDTSESMEESSICPPHMDVCSRMDVARWAMRRVIPSAIDNTRRSDEPGKVALTGIVSYGNVSAVSSALDSTGAVFYDPGNTAHTTRTDQETAELLNAKLMSACPSGLTPLGTHLQALADDLGDGDEDRPNKITVVSDGENTWGRSPEGVARYIRDNYPHMEVDIIDLSGNPALLYIAQTTGGTYYSAANSDELLNSLYKSAGICQPYVPIQPDDEKGCGSIY